MNMTVECAFKGICHLGECPVWNVDVQKLYWTDILNRRIWVYDPAVNESKIFWEGRHQVGGFTFTKKGGMVLCTDSGVLLLGEQQMKESNPEPRKIFDVPMIPGERFNDITVDPRGRIFAGTMRSDCVDGTLYRIEKDKKPVPLFGGLGCSNGMTFTMDEKIFFHTETMTRTITRYDYDVHTGQITSAAVFFRGTEQQGLPDGITIDTEDHIWVAFWGGSAVRRLDPDGKIVDEIQMPAKQPSSLIFGGRNLSDLYIASGCEGGADIEKGLDENGEFLGGPLYKCRTQFTGRKEWLADFEWGQPLTACCPNTEQDFNNRSF